MFVAPANVAKDDEVHVSEEIPAHVLKDPGASGAEEGSEAVLLP